MTRSPDENLYARVLGAAWHELAPAVRSAHVPGAEKRGAFRVSHGGNWFVRMLAKCLGLPRSAVHADVVLKIVEEGDRQRWERSFDGKPWVTTQWAGEGGGLLERSGSWELSFQLRVGDGALFYEQTRARFRLGPLRLPLPWSLRVAASEKPEGPARVRVSIDMRLPLLGQLIAYEGWLSVKEEEAVS